jgi:hypothetical protein
MAGAALGGGACVHKSSPHEQPGNHFPEFSQSRTKLWQGVLTLPRRRPKERSPTRTPAGNLQSSRQPGCGDSLETRAEHPSTESQEVISGPSLRAEAATHSLAPGKPGWVGAQHPRGHYSPAPRSMPPAPRQASGVRSCADPAPLATACHQQPNWQRPNGTRS